MKAIMVMFDSLNRRMLPPYGCDWIHAPNFERLARRSVTFDNCYVGSMPCIPARREIHTGRYNFLHRSWGPLEPFDDSMPERLRRGGVYTHLATDHYHYWEEAGSRYLDRYNTWEIARGQEGDTWKGEVADPDAPETVGADGETNKVRQSLRRQDWINRNYMQDRTHPQVKTFDLGLDFIRTNRQADNWFLHLEAFDPHEPYFSMQKYKELYPHAYNGPHFDWPVYGRVKESPEQVRHARYEYAALVSMCDESLGRVLDLMDELDLWQDTLLIVNTDHGFLLGEHGWWGKNQPPFYNEIAHAPLFIWDPRSGRRDERRQALVQTIDLPPTLLDFFGLETPPDVQGRALNETIAGDAPVREAGLFGIHGKHVNCTDGRYVYMRAPADAANAPLYDYTLMPPGIDFDRLRRIELAGPFSFTKGCRVMQIPKSQPAQIPEDTRTMLFDLAQDPAQAQPIHDPAVEQRMVELLIRLMKENDAPPEQFERLGLASP